MPQNTVQIIARTLYYCTGCGTLSDILVHRLCQLSPHFTNTDGLVECSERSLSPPPHNRQIIPTTFLLSWRAVHPEVGDAYILGPLTGEHWLFYDALYLPAPQQHLGGRYKV